MGRNSSGHPGKLEMVQNKRRTESDTDDDDDDDEDDDDMPEKPEHQQYMTHPKETEDTCQYGPIRKKMHCSYIPTVK